MHRRALEIPARLDQLVTEAVTRHLVAELGQRGLLLTAGGLAAAGAQAARRGARLRGRLLQQCYPTAGQDGGSVRFENQHTAPRLDAALAFGAATAHVLADPDEPVAEPVELLCATFNLGIGLVDGLCDDNPDMGAALLELIEDADLARAVEVRRGRQWLDPTLPSTLLGHPAVAFTVDVVEAFFETLHQVHPGEASLPRRRRVGAQLATALQAERDSVTQPADQIAREELLACSRLTSVLPFQVIEALANGAPAPEPTAGTRIGEAMWRIDDLVDVCEDARRGSLNSVLLAATAAAGRPSERELLAALESLLGSTEIADAAAEAADGLLAGLPPASPEDSAGFLYFVQRYAGIEICPPGTS